GKERTNDIRPSTHAYRGEDWAGSCTHGASGRWSNRSLVSLTNSKRRGGVRQRSLPAATWRFEELSMGCTYGCASISRIQRRAPRLKQVRTSSSPAASEQIARRKTAPSLRRNNGRQISCRNLLCPTSFSGRRKTTPRKRPDQSLRVPV